MARPPQKALEQVYALEGWRGVAKRLPELEGRTDSAKRSAVYRIVRGYPNQPRQSVSDEGQANVNRRAGRLLARRTVRDDQGREVVDDTGEVVKTPISPQNNAKLAIYNINAERRDIRGDARDRYSEGEISQDELDQINEEYARLTPAQRAAFEDYADANDWDSFRASYGSASGEL